jgi:hypothetical protein
MKTELEILEEKHSIAMGALANIETMFRGLTDTPDDATLGNLRTIITAYESTTKKSLHRAILQ